MKHLKIAKGPRQQYTLTRELGKLLAGRTKDDIIFACVGTDRSTGDSLGPLVGHILQQRGYNVVGTLADPLHAMNLHERIETELKPSGKYIIAIDACLGQSTSIESIQLINGPLNPGAGVQKELPPVGDISIAGIVNVGGFMEFMVLQNTRLSLVFNIVNIIVASIESTLKKNSKGAKRRELVNA